jgi:hypothetical protein
MKKTRNLPRPSETVSYPPLLEEDEEAAALMDMTDIEDLSEEEAVDQEDRFFIPSFTKKYTFFTPTSSDYDDAQVPNLGDALKIRHNFVMLMHLMAEENDKPETKQRFTGFTEDRNTHLNNKRIDFQLRGTDNHFYPAYCYRHQKKIVYGVSDETMADPNARNHALPALIQLAQADIHQLTQMVKKPQPPFEVDTTQKEPAVIQEILGLL